MDDITKDALADHRHDPPGDWDESERTSMDGVGRSRERGVIVRADENTEDF